jgi:hypothetical protein
MGAEGTWMPESERTTAWYLFKQPFMCRVSNIQSMSIEYIQKFGMPSSGYANHDKETANELVIRMLTISQMVEYYKNGVTVAVVNHIDTKEIYERISDHLNAWKQNIEVSFHTRDAPVEDLMLLDKFANVVYAHAVYQFTTEIVDSLLSRRLTTVLKTNRQAILAPPVNTTINPVTDTLENDRAAVFPERTSMASSFGDNRPSSGINGKWR